LKHYKITKDFTKDDLRSLIESGLKRDLHMHTLYSDGALTPREVLKMRVDEGYQLLAITDHDGVEGSVYGEKYADEFGIEYISGIEFDSEDELGKDLHMLGYGFDPDHPAFNLAIGKILKQRNDRNNRFLEALNAMGYHITYDELKAVNDGRFMGKPTFATVLIKKGVVRSHTEAFNTIFQEPEIKCIKKKTLHTKDVVDIIHEAGGLAVLAHPMEQRHRDETFEQFKPRMYQILDRMVSYGIDGLECHHPSADYLQQQMLVAYANEHGLMITEGSDFHSHDSRRDFSRYHMP
jgi:predicted metal-dependent phosphoesterase TrpH